MFVGLLVGMFVLLLVRIWPMAAIARAGGGRERSRRMVLCTLDGRWRPSSAFYPHDAMRRAGL